MIAQAGQDGTSTDLVDLLVVGVTTVHKSRCLAFEKCDVSAVILRSVVVNRDLARYVEDCVRLLGRPLHKQFDFTALCFAPGYS
jgi:hypothetical protein